MKGDDLAERLMRFAVLVIRLTQALPKGLVGRHIAGQLIRAGTSVGANHEEARGAESRADFIHKLGVACKELRESSYWLLLIHHAELVKPVLLDGLIQEATERKAHVARSLKTARENARAGEKDTTDAAG